MPTNLELKIKIVSVSKMEKAARKMNAKYIGLLKQKDIYYNFKEGLLKLRVESGSYYLIKYIRDEKGERWSEYEILELKGKNVEQYLSGILNVETIVEKKRKLYMYKNTRIHLDEVKNLGSFLELETVVKTGKKSATREFNEVVKSLNIELKKQIKISYRNLINK